MKKFLRGFTLSEVLIALGIIGVIASLTMPSLQKSVSDKALTAQLIKADASLTEGIKRYMAAEDISDATGNSFDFETFVTEYLDILQTCTSGSSACFADKYKGGTERTRNDIFADGAKAYILKDGTTITGEYITLASITVGLRIFIDVNGKEKPNKCGQDLHIVSFTPNGSLESWVYVANKRWTLTPEQQQELFTKGLETCETTGGEYCYSALKRNGFKHLKKSTK